MTHVQFYRAAFGNTVISFKDSEYKDLVRSLPQHQMGTDNDSVNRIRLNMARQCCLMYNKRGQRALGRSPEEKVKGHSGANNREPQGHNLNAFGKGPFDDVIY